MNIVTKGFGTPSIITKGFGTIFIRFLFKLGRRILNLSLIRKSGIDLNRTQDLNSIRTVNTNKTIITSLNTNRSINVHGD